MSSLIDSQSDEDHGISDADNDEDYENNVRDANVMPRRYQPEEFERSDDVESINSMRIYEYQYDRAGFVRIPPRINDHIQISAQREAFLNAIRNKGRWISQQNEHKLTKLERREPVTILLIMG